jgi:uncharacterized protein (TIGR02186 family)
MDRTHCKSFKWLSFLILALIPCMAYAAAPMTMTASPTNILMGARFDGVTLKASGTIPAGSDVILRFTGAPEELHLRKKGKVFGLLWMNTGKVVLNNVPRIFLVESSRSFDQLGAAATPFQLASLKSSIKVEEGASSGDVDVIHELLLLKKNDGLYTETTGGIHLGPDTGATRTFAAEIAIPSAVAPGHYNIEAVAVKDGVVVGQQATDVEAKLIGFPAWLSKMAFNNGLLYGILATVIAVVSGLAIGLVFQSKGAH